VDVELSALDVELGAVRVRGDANVDDIARIQGDQLANGNDTVGAVHVGHHGRLLNTVDVDGTVIGQGVAALERDIAANNEHATNSGGHSYIVGRGARSRPGGQANRGPVNLLKDAGRGDGGGRARSTELAVAGSTAGRAGGTLRAGGARDALNTL
jgi:hypothetical protein